MWKAIFSSITVILPSLVKLLMYVLDKKDDEHLKGEFLKFISAIEGDLSIKLKREHQERLTAIKEQLRLEGQEKSILNSKYINYKSAYEELLTRYEELKCQNLPK